MLTSTISSELQFYSRLEELVIQRHPGLRFEIPPPYPRGGEWPRPDVVITNPRTGAVLGAEVRVGYQAKHIPLSLLSLVRGVRERLRSDHSESADLVVITTGEILEILKPLLDKDGIGYLEVSSPEEAIERLEPRLERL
jgi:hypothetical protein